MNFHHTSVKFVQWKHCLHSLVVTISYVLQGSVPVLKKASMPVHVVFSYSVHECYKQMAWISTCPLMKGIKTKATVDAYKFTYVCTVIKNDIIFATRVLQNELY